VARHLTFTLTILLALGCVNAWADEIPVGVLAWDVTFPGNAGEFDITNLTGANELPPAFPITNLLNLSSLSLTVDFVGGGSAVYGPGSGYFSLNPDGESFDGSSIPIGGTNPLPIDATLTGTFSPLTITLDQSVGGGTVAIEPDFSTTFSDTPNLVNGDLGLIEATTVEASTPEPSSMVLLATVASFDLFYRLDGFLGFRGVYCRFCVWLS
jgi:hypothetical protein